MRSDKFRAKNGYVMPFFQLSRELHEKSKTLIHLNYPLYQILSVSKSYSTGSLPHNQNEPIECHHGR